MVMRADFLAALRERLEVTYDWASDTAKLERFMESVDKTLDGANTWNHSGKATTKAWRQIGGTKRPTLRDLRALPKE